MSTTNPIDLTQNITANASAGPAEPAASQQDRPWLDRIGVGASLACAVHCMIAPFLLLLLPTAGTVWAHPAVHWVLALLVVPLALWVIRNGYRKHKKRITLLAAWAGTACIVAGLIAPMINGAPVFTVTLPSGDGLGSITMTTDAGEGATCSEGCCPSIATHAGATSITFPPGGLITLIGSLFLVLAHGSNLVACRCYSKKSVCEDGQSTCGCRA